MILPAEARLLLDAFVPVFTALTFSRFVTLSSANLCNGRRTIANLLSTAGPLCKCHRTANAQELASGV